MRLILLFLPIVLLYASCTKEENIPESPSIVGTGNALVNDISLDFSSYGIRFNPSLGLSSMALEYYQNGFLRKEIGFSFFKNTLDKQILSITDFDDQENPQVSYGTLLDDGDVAGNYYFLNEDDEIEDYIQFTSFNETTGEVSGIFQASFVIDTTFIVDPSSPDTIVITDGYFETKIVE